MIWTQHTTRAHVEKVLDTRLAESARMVSSLIADHRIALNEDGGSADFDLPPMQGITHKLSCQIWALDDTGRMLGRSDGAPEKRLTDSDADGYSQSDVEGGPWRVYSVTNPKLGVRVMVGDSIAVRDGLVRDVIESLLLPAAIILPILGALIWISVGRGLAPLNRLAEALRRRDPSDFSPLPAGPAPCEIRPVRLALDSLFERLAAARRRERDFVAYAAHELKTPLAGLRTQAQVARLANDPETRDRALRAIETSVVRTDRMVRQLLDLTQAEAGELPMPETCLGPLVEEVLSGLQIAAGTGEVRLSAGGDALKARIRTNPDLLSSALQNLVENAIHASPAGGTVTVTATTSGADLRLAVRDQGPGLPEAIRDRATERFVRGPARNGAQGSGLGLSIVTAIMQRLGGDLGFDTPAEGGLIARLTLPGEVIS